MSDIPQNASPELFRLMLDHMPNSSVMMFDLDMRYTLVGGPFLQRFGMTPGQFIGRQPQDILPPESCDFIISVYKRALAGESFNYKRSTSDYDYQAFVTPIRDAAGQIIGGMVLSHDITEIRRSTDALQTSEQQFRATFEYAAIGMALVAMDGHWLQVNRALCEIVGYSEAELLARTFQDITHPDDLDSDLNYAQQLSAGEIESYQLEKRYFHKQGHIVWVSLSVSLVRDTDGKPLHFVSQIQNITERKQDDELLKSQIEREWEFNAYLEALHEITLELTNIDDIDKFYKRAVEFGLQRLGFDRFGILLYDAEHAIVKGTYGTDGQGNLIDEHHIQLDPSNLTGTLKRAYEKDDRFMFDEDAQLFAEQQPIGRGWNAAAILWNGVEKLGWLAIDNGATHIPMSRATLDILGLYALTLGTLLVQKDTQTALVEQRNLLRTLIDNIPDYIFLKDAQGRFILTNTAHAQASGNLAPQELIGKNAFDVFPGHLAAKFHADDQALIQSGESLINAERETTDGQGNHKLVLTTKIPWRNSNGHVVGLVGISRDITDRKHLADMQRDREKLQTALDKERELSQLKTRMMERITHEFRTPLTIIQASTETLTSYLDRLTPEQKAARFSAIQQTNQHLTNMLDEIGLVVSGNLSPDNLVTRPVNLSQLIRSIALELEERFALSNKFVLNIPDAITVLADQQLLKLGLFHIMRNATRFSSPDSIVTVSASLVENTVEILVVDTGIGILPIEQPRIFDPFFRGSNLNEVGGLGLGLTIAHGAIEAHKGEITVESVPQQGTTVRITLPA